MALVSKTFRIFISSTFSDLKEERNALQRDVFPELRDLCNMIVRTEDFNMEEFLGYAKNYIKEIFNDEDIVLVEGTFEDFVGTHEILARAIHESYRHRQEEKGETRETNASMVPWDQLPENLKESNRRQADHIRIKLKAIGCSIAPMTDWDGKPFKFSKEEIDLMARMEHERWMSERLQAGSKIICL